MKKSITTRQKSKPVLQPAALSLFEKRDPVKEIARRLDKRPLSKLEAQVADALKQIVARAHTGDDNALASYFKTARYTVMSLDNLVRHEPKRMRTIAERSSDFPVLLSLNPQDIKAATKRLQLLNVGAKAILPTRSGQKTDRRNLWTRLAIYAFNACLENFRRVQQIETQLTGAKQNRVKRKLWGTIENGTEYKLPDGKRTVIADWQRECVKLAGQITADNFNQWRSVVKICVLDFWKHSNRDYIEALDEVGNPKDKDGNPKLKECNRRHLAINRTLQAFKSQFLRR
jgi:hypothetical protein